MKMNNKFYDIMKYIVTIALPAVTVLYSTLAQIWGWQDSAAITATLAAVTTFLGALICISSAKYKKGDAIDFDDENDDE